MSPTNESRSVVVMTPHAHGPHHSHPDRPGHGPAPEHLHAELSELLDLDAVLGASVLDEATDAAATALGTEPAVIVDLGAGSGTGTVALSGRFGDARIHSLDASPGMLERLSRAVANAGASDRVEPHLVDLDGDWPSVLPAPVDLAWAALSLHHVTDPARLLKQVFTALRPGGVLVVIEMSDATRYEPADLGTTRTGLGERVVSALSARGYPVTADWSDALEAAGFDPVERADTGFTASATTPDGARYLELQFARTLPLIADDLPADDLAALGTVVESVASRESELTVTSGRIVWVAVRPGGPR
jgi:SAM-dependent methyltransferase